MVKAKPAALPLLIGLVAFTLGLRYAPAPQSSATTLDVDATRAAMGLLHAHLVFPASAGQMTVAYPKWIPGEHAPTGPINQVIRLIFSAQGKQLP